MKRDNLRASLDAALGIGRAPPKTDKGVTPRKAHKRPTSDSQETDKRPTNGPHTTPKRHVRIDDETWAELAAWARGHGLSVSAAIRLAVTRALQSESESKSEKHAKM